MICILNHHALPITGPSGFVDAAAGTAVDALSHDAVPVILAGEECIAEVRGALGSDRGRVIGVDMAIDGRNPARLLPALQRFLDDYPDRELWCVGEPIRAGDPDRVISEITLHELLLHLPVFADWRARVICAYDADALPPDVVATIEATHSPSNTDPADTVARARARPLPPRPVDSKELGVDRTTLGALRGFIESGALRAGLTEERADDLVYAVNEVVTNSLCHGEGRARVSLWFEPTSVVSEVRDRGWVRDPLAGRIAPHPDRVNGRGLWLVNQLCDLVQLRSSPGGTTVRMHVDM